MNNPFKVKGLAQGDGFFNRQKEIKDLLQRIVEGQHTLLLAPRRIGKTSLIHRVLEEKQKHSHAPVAFIDLFLCSSPEDFYRIAIAKLLSAHQEKSVEAFFKKIRTTLPRIVPKLSFSPSGEPEFSLGSEKGILNFDDLAQTLVWFDGLSKKNVLIFDEVQEIANYPESEALEKKLRSVIQTLKNTAIVYSGSHPSILKEMFSKRGRAFFQSALQYEIGFANKDDAFDYLQQKLKLSLTPKSILDSIVSLTQGHPYYVQLMGYVAFELFRESKKWETVSESKIFEAAVHLERTTFEMMISPLTQIQKQVFRAICRNPNEPILSASFIRTHELPGPSSVRVAAKKLESIGYIIKAQEGYFASDPLLAKWWGIKS